MKVLTVLLTFILIIAGIGVYNGTIKLNPDNYKNYTFEEQAQIMGQQFNDSINTVMETGEYITVIGQAIIKTITTAAGITEDIKNFFIQIGQGIKDLFNPGEGPFGGGGGRVW